MPSRARSRFPLPATTRSWTGGALAVLLLMAFTTGAADLGESVRFNIAAQSLDTALLRFSEQAGIQVLATAQDVADKKTTGVRGEYTAEKALLALLKGSGLAYRRISDRAVTIDAQAVEGASGLNGAAKLPLQVAQVELDGVATAEQDETEREQSARNKPTGSPRQSEIVVTGTHLRGVRNDALPVISISREEIRETGLATLPEVIQRLPQNFRAFDFLTGSSHVDLRGLGTNYTLVLINGRRTAQSNDNVSDGVDLSMIPLEAVDRIEVLTDGAGATYGSDAIGGVVNVILRKDFTGLQTSLRYGTVTEGSFDIRRASQSAGMAWSGGNALLTYVYEEQGALGGDEREVSRDFPIEMVSAHRQHGASASVNHALSGTWELFGDARFGQRDSTRNVTGLPDSPYVTESLDYGLTVGSRFSLGSTWELEVSASASRSEPQYSIAFAPTYLSATELEGKTGIYEATASGEAFVMPGGVARLSVGAQYLETDYVSRNLVNGMVLGTNELVRDTPAFYAELFVPLVGAGNSRSGVQRLELTVAGRYDDYDVVSGATNPKVSVLWSPMPGLNFRANWGTGFKAPSLLATGQVGVLSQPILQGGVPDPQSGTGTSIALRRFGVVPSLGPEESTNLSFGVDIRPAALEGLRLSLTYSDIDLTDKIGLPAISLLEEASYASVVMRRPPAGDTAGNAAFDALITQYIADAGGVVRYSGGTSAATPLSSVGAIFDSRTRNLAGVRSRNLDLLFDYQWSNSMGRFSADANIAYLLEQSEQVTPTAPAADDIDVYSRPVDWRLRGHLGWARGRWATNGYLNYSDGYRDNRPGLQGPIGSWTTVDFSVRCDLGEADSGWLDGLSLALNATNLFDRQPPSTAPGYPGDVTFDVANADPLGRFVSVEVTKAW